MPTYNVATVNDLVAKLLLAQGATSQVIINLTASNYDLSTYSGIANIANDDQFGTGATKSGLPVIKKNVLIQTSSAISMATITRTNPNYKYRHFYVSPMSGAKLMLRNVTLSNGDVGLLDAGGGAIFSENTLDLRNCRFGPNNISNYGGAILNQNASSTIVNCEIFQNEADWGGGLYNTGSITLKDSRIAGNRKPPDIGGDGAGFITFGNLTIEHCMITQNIGWNGGGGAVWGANGVANCTVPKCGGTDRI